jgi:hypothetical protein
LELLTSVTGPVIEVSLSKGSERVGVFATQLRTETDPVSETSCSLVFLEYHTMDTVQEPSNSEFLFVLRFLLFAVTFQDRKGHLLVDHF